MAAQSSDRLDSSDPSTPTTILRELVSVLLVWAYSGRRMTATEHGAWVRQC